MKIGSFVKFPCFLPFLSYGPQITQESTFFAICADLSKKSKSIITIYLCASESTYYIISESDIKPFQKWFIGVRVTAHEILRIRIFKKMLTRQKLDKIFLLQTLNISEAVSHSIKKFYFLKKRKETFQMYTFKLQKCAQISC